MFIVLLGAVVQPEFGALKPTLPTGSLPNLDLGGVLYPQSKAIEMYVARKAGLYPVDTELALIVDVVREVGCVCYWCHLCAL